jgi:hypothetical protein
VFICKKESMVVDRDGILYPDLRKGAISTFTASKAYLKIISFLMPDAVVRIVQHASAAG